MDVQTPDTRRIGVNQIFQILLIMKNLSFEELKTLAESVAEDSLLEQVSGGTSYDCHDCNSNPVYYAGGASATASSTGVVSVSNPGAVSGPTATACTGV